MNAKNSDGTWNVLDFTKEIPKMIVVEDDWLDSVGREGLIGIELHSEVSGKKLKTEYSNGKELWYELCSGTWGFPISYD